MFYKIFPIPCQNTTDTGLGRCRIIELPLFAPGKDHPIVLPNRVKTFIIFPNHLLNASNPTTSVPSKYKPEPQRIPTEGKGPGTSQLPS